MVDATLSRGGMSISLPVRDEAGTPLLARDFGKPNHGVESVNDPDPRPKQDAQSGNETITITTQIHTYQTALELADLIKAHSGGEAITLDIPLGEYENSISTVPAVGQDEALTLAYPPGQGETINVDLSLSRVNQVFGTNSGFSADTPRASGSGPITLSSSSRSVVFERSQTVERSLGRPNSGTFARYSDYPKVQDERKSSYDAFDISLTSIADSVQKVTALRNMFRKRRGRDTLTLDFNGLYGMGAFSVVPRGSGALRHVRIAGQAEDQTVPQIQLRVTQ